MDISAISKLGASSPALAVAPGDTVRVHQKIKEGEKERVSVFEGLVLARKHGREAGATFTVRKVVDGIGVERIFPIHSPTIAKVEVIRRSKVHRAKLYYIRDKAAREVRRKMKNILVAPAAPGNGMSEVAA